LFVKRGGSKKSYDLAACRSGSRALPGPGRGSAEGAELLAPALSGAEGPGAWGLS